MPRFTILRHTIGNRFAREESVATSGVASGPVHWDWLFEREPPQDLAEVPGDRVTAEAAMLTTWASDPVIELTQEGDPRIYRSFAEASLGAIRLTDHRGIYLDYEGEIGDDRGTVDQVATGAYRVKRAGENELSVELTLKSSRFLLVPQHVTVRFNRVASELPAIWNLEIAPAG